MTKVYLNSLFFNLSLTAKGIIMFIALGLSNINELDSQNKFKVVIDAGHGGKMKIKKRGCLGDIKLGHL